jgi:hypothetical protein
LELAHRTLQGQSTRAGANLREFERNLTAPSGQNQRILCFGTSF